MNRLIVPIIALLAMCQTRVEAGIPRLVVLLSVEELRTDLVEELSPYLSDDGLKRLLNEGQVYNNVNHPLTMPDATASQAILHTGTTALANNIACRRPLSRTGNGMLSAYKSVFHDEEYIGFATSDRMSPRRLSATTIADKLKQASRRSGLVYSIAPNAEEAIIAGGRHANGVYWIDDYNGRWVSSTYYKDGYPAYVERLNSPSEGLLQRLPDTSWTPLYSSEPLGKYGRIPYSFSGTIPTMFKHSFSSNGEGVVRYKQSGLINDEVVKVAEQLIVNTEIGRDATPDMLAVHLYAGNHARATQDVSTELIDTYYRLDRAIATILKLIDNRIGIDHTLIALSGSGQAREFVADSEVTGYFHKDRCKALMNMYLMAKYGNGDWLEEVSDDGQIFLNRKLIEERKISLQEIQRKASDFLLDFSGVQFAVTDHELRERATYDGKDNPLFLSCLNRATNKDRGDVVFDLLPGWAFIQPGSTTDAGVYKQGVVTTLFLLRAPSIRSEVISSPIDLRDISTSICFALRIRPPTPGRMVASGLLKR